MSQDTDLGVAQPQTPVLRLRIRSRLSRLALKGTGITVRDCLAHAAAAVETMREPCLAEIDLCLAALKRDFGAGAKDRDQRDLDEAYRLSGRIIDSAFAVPAWGLDTAGRAVCDLVDGFEETGAADWPAFEVHVQAIALLRALGDSLSQSDRAAVLDGLRAVKRKHAGEAP